jgi:hypothetical protein
MLLIRPKGMTMNSYKPLWVRKAVLYYSRAAMQIWWHPALKSNLVNQQAPANSSNNSSTIGMWCLFLTVIASKCLLGAFLFRRAVPGAARAGQPIWAPPHIPYRSTELVDYDYMQL